MTLLSGHQDDTYFVTEHIDELKLYVKIAWFGDNLRYVTRELLKHFTDNRLEPNNKAFVVVHWTPSEIIDADIEYETITMPKCEQFKSESSKDTMCKYELTPILKYSSLPLKKYPAAHSTFSIINFERSNEMHLLQMYNNITDLKMPKSEVNFDKTYIDNKVQNDKILNSASDKEKIYDEIACRFIKENKEHLLREFIRLPGKKKREVFIGGIYPNKEEAPNEHFGKKNFFFD